MGVMAGAPTGISFSQPFTAGALNLGLGWHLSGEGLVHVHADYVRNLKLDINGSVSLPAYYGAGGVLRLGRKGALGGRIPAGLLYRITPHPFEVFVEAAPVFYLFPDTKFDFTAAVGIRYIWP